MTKWRTLAMIIGGVIGCGVAVVVVMIAGPFTGAVNSLIGALLAFGGMGVADTFYEIFTTGR